MENSLKFKRYTKDRYTIRGVKLNQDLWSYLYNKENSTIRVNDSYVLEAVNLSAPKLITNENGTVEPVEDYESCFILYNTYNDEATQTTLDKVLILLPSGETRIVSEKFTEDFGYKEEEC